MVAVPFRKEIFKFDIQESSLNPLAKTELEKNRESLDEHASSTLEAVVDLSANIDETVPAESGLTPTASDEIISEATPARTYSVITGSFQVRQNALAQAAILRESGFDAGIIEADNGFYRVSAGNFDNIDAASAHRNALKEDFPGSWINKAD
jgi:cell division protein FtsN